MGQKTKLWCIWNRHPTWSHGIPLCISEAIAIINSTFLVDISDGCEKNTLFWGNISKLVAEINFLPSSQLKIIYRILSVLRTLLYLSAALKLMLREEHRLRMFKKKCWGDYRGQTRGRKIERTTQWRASQFVYFTKSFKGDQIKEDEIMGTCNTYGSVKKYKQHFSYKAWRKVTT